MGGFTGMELTSHLPRVVRVLNSILHGANISACSHPSLAGGCRRSLAPGWQQRAAVSQHDSTFTADG